MSSGNSPKTPTRLALPTFDPNPSVRFACEVLQATRQKGALIGRIAIWAWLNNPSRQTFTKDVDIAVARSAQPTLHAYLQ